MLKPAILLCALLAVSLCEETETKTNREERRNRFLDPFAALDRHISHTLAHQSYLWPWNQLFRTAIILDTTDEPQLTSDDKNYYIKMSAKSFKPDELKVKVKNRNIIVEGKHKETNEHQQHFMTNHFVQRFALPAGSKQEEVTAVLNEKRELVISVPRHEVPPPPPEIEVPIEVKLPAETSSSEEKETDKTEKPLVQTTSTEKLDSQLSVEKLDSEASGYGERKPLKRMPEKPIKKVTPELLSTKKPIVETSEKANQDEFATEKFQASSATPLDTLELQEATTHIGKIRKKELKDTKTTKDNEVTKERFAGNGLDYLLIDAE